MVCRPRTSNFDDVCIIGVGRGRRKHAYETPARLRRRSLRRTDDHFRCPRADRTQHRFWKHHTYDTELHFRNQQLFDYL